jgi:predicted acetyltransferase
MLKEYSNKSRGAGILFEFMNFNYLSDGEIDLIIEEKAEAHEPKGYLPAYKYEIRLHNDQVRIGRVDLRIGDNKNTYYGGNIGYEIEELYRGHHYASKACKLVKQVAQAHKMDKVIITCNPHNIPSRKTCENVGARLVEIVELPQDNEMYQLGDRQKCRYEWVLI